MVAGDAANVSVMIAINGNPHSFEPSPPQAMSLGNADAVFSIGLRIEENLIPIIEAQGDAINHVIVSECVPIWSSEALICRWA